MSVDMNQLQPTEIVELAYALAGEMEKTAAAQEQEYPYGFDLNELNVEQFIHFGAAVEDEMNKIAAAEQAEEATPEATEEVEQQTESNPVADILARIQRR